MQAFYANSVSLHGFDYFRDLVFGQADRERIREFLSLFETSQNFDRIQSLYDHATAHPDLYDTDMKVKLFNYSRLSDTRAAFDAVPVTAEEGDLIDSLDLFYQGRAAEFLDRLEDAALFSLPILAKAYIAGSLMAGHDLDAEKVAALAEHHASDVDIQYLAKLPNSDLLREMNTLPDDFASPTVLLFVTSGRKQLIGYWVKYMSELETPAGYRIVCLDQGAYDEARKFTESAVLYDVFRNGHAMVWGLFRFRILIAALLKHRGVSSFVCGADAMWGKNLYLHAAFADSAPEILAGLAPTTVPYVQPKWPGVFNMDTICLRSGQMNHEIGTHLVSSYLQQRGHDQDIVALGINTFDSQIDWTERDGYFTGQGKSSYVLFDNAVVSRTEIRKGGYIFHQRFHDAKIETLTKGLLK